VLRSDYVEALIPRVELAKDVDAGSGLVVDGAHTAPEGRQVRILLGGIVPRSSTDSHVNAQNRKTRILDLLGLVRVDYEVRRLKSVRSALISMGHVAAGLGSLPASELESEHLRHYIISRREQGAAEGTIRIELAFLRRAYRLGVRQRRIHRSLLPDDWPQIATDKLKVRRGFLREEDVNQVCLYLESEVLVHLVRFLFASAWRRGEALALQWSWVDDEAIRLPDSKNGQPRLLALAGEVAEIIEARRARAIGPHVFHRGGEPIRDFRTAWMRACEKAGLQGRLVHDLRRSAIKRMVEAGVDQRTAMSISGHLTVSTFQRYMIVDARRQAEALELLRSDPEKRSQAREHLAEKRKPRTRIGRWG
jgi:integrase